MSEEEPEDNTKPVYYVTGKNYAALMAQTDKHSEYWIILNGDYKIVFSSDRILRAMVRPLQGPRANIRKAGRALQGLGRCHHRQVGRHRQRIRRYRRPGLPHHQILGQGRGSVRLSFFVSQFLPVIFTSEQVDYNGGRDLDSMIKFIESGGTEGNEASDDVSTI